MSLKYWFLIMFVIAIYSRSSAHYCTRSYVDGKWISEEDCGGTEMMSEIIKELQRRSEEEKKWTVFQRRKHRNVDFYRSLADYEKGFGERDGDFWLGLEELHEKTKDGNTELEINMITKDTRVHRVAKYSDFRIGPGTDKYRLRVSGFSGNASVDGLAWSNNQRFSTKDEDHDVSSSNCASAYEGGWWYGDCADSNLNGNFNKTGGQGIWWNDGGSFRFLRSSEMKFRRRL